MFVRSDTVRREPPTPRQELAERQLDQLPDPLHRVEDLRPTLLAALLEPRDPDAPPGSEGVLSPNQAVRVAEAVGAMAEPSWVALRPEVTPVAADRDGVVAQGTVLAAVAARRDTPDAALDEVLAFGRSLQGSNADQILALTTATQVGMRKGLRQTFTDSCGPTALQLIRMEADPLEVARWLHATDHEAWDLEQETVLEDHWNQTAKPWLNVERLRAMGASPALLRWVEAGVGTEEDARRELDALRMRRGTLPTPSFAEVRALMEMEDLGLFGRLFTRTLTGLGDGDLVEEGTGRMGLTSIRGTLEELEDLEGEALLDGIEALVIEGRDCAVRVDTDGLFASHYVVFTDVVGPRGTRQFRVHDPAHGRTAWLAEGALLDGDWGALDPGDQLHELESAVG